jgi:plasmid stabilization system protein ParE
VKYAVRFRPEVPDDIVEACHWYESHKTGLSKRFLYELNATLERIAAAPEAYAKGERDVRAARLRQFPYVVHFRITKIEVVVIAVMYGGRDPSMWQNRA